MKTMRWLVWLSIMLLGTAAWAEDDAEGLSVAYVNLMPGLVGNYDLGDKRLKFYKADIALRVNAANKDRVEYHMPLIRDQLVSLFVQQTEENFSTTEGKEAVRQAALLRIQQVLLQEEGQAMVEDLLFNNLVVQK